ncbi:hypothetical protein S58_64640 [Bradyrhizobium oligotrophicum S58]|uniref:Glycosyltransferase RgtA/B/C/D-like domain-containing protein n=2 Tax=Bradyrhizobium oligotrophicum TaxID=44255 RepID=M4ZF11_9BRAD|nr:hypothetical protein S58_64640 [Bradyrhizobium oligotrophicum S58]
MPRRWTLLALMLTVVLALPFLLVDVPPVLDYPNHLARFYVLAHPDDPVLSQMYAPNWRILPNLGMDLIGVALLRFTDVHLGGRLLLALSLFAPLAGVVAYHRAVFGRWSPWPLAAGVIAYNGAFLLGFMNFQLSLGVALGCAAGWVMLRRRDGWLPAIAWGAIAAAVAFLCHIFGLVFFALLVGAGEADRLWRLRRSPRFVREVVVVAGALTITLGPAMLLYALCPLGDGGLQLGAWVGPHKLWRIMTPFVTTSGGLTVITAIAVMALLILVRRQLVVAPGIPLALAVLFVGFVAAPWKALGGTFIDMRLAAMGGLLLFAGLQPVVSGRTAVLAGTFLAALMLVRTADIASAWIDHRGDLAELRAAIAQVPPGARVIAAHGGDSPVPSRRERTLPGFRDVDSHLAALLVIERRAFWPLMFAHPSQQPIVIRPAFLRFAASSWTEPAAWRWLQPDTLPDDVLPLARYLANWRSDFDAVLLLDPPAPEQPVAGLTPLYRGSYVQLFRTEQGGRGSTAAQAPAPNTADERVAAQEDDVEDGRITSRSVDPFKGAPGPRQH